MSKNKSKNVAEAPAPAVPAAVAPVTELDKQLAEMEANIAKLQAERDAATAAQAKARQEAVAALPAQFGVGSIAELIALIYSVTGKPRRQKISDAVRAQVKEYSIAGMTAKDIAAKTGISMPSVNVIRKAAGLTKPRKAKAAAVAA